MSPASRSVLRYELYLISCVFPALLGVYRSQMVHYSSVGGPLGAVGKFETMLFTKAEASEPTTSDPRDMRAVIPDSVGSNQAAIAASPRTF